MALIEYKNVSIFHQDDDAVLNGIDFNVDEGEFIYIIGKVGSGKSSLLRTFYAELDIEEAEKAEVLGRDMMTIRRKEVPALRRELGIIFQNFQLLTDRSVSKNLEFVLKATGWEKEDIPARIEEVLQSVGMEAARDKMPYQLSGGEQQRIAIARSLLNNPKVILADEPTGNLDPETADNIVALLKDITATGTAVVMTTHNLPMLDKYPGIVYQCGEGKLEDITAQYRQFQQEEE
jgi:cell division transport system ATP-binding protein